MEAEVGQRLGTSKFLVIFDTDKSDAESVPNPGAEARGSGMQAVALAVSRHVDVVLTGYCSPMARRYLSENGVAVVTGVGGKVGEAIQAYRRGDLGTGKGDDTLSSKRDELVMALKSSSRQFLNLLPILLGVLLLIGLFNVFVSRQALASIFSGDAGLDTLWGACLGSILTGNPINSYVIGGELLNQGVSLFAVTAFIVSWVSVGLIQLPAEVAALGKRFALLRNAFAFLLSIGIALLTVMMLKIF